MERKLNSATKKAIKKAATIARRANPKATKKRSDWAIYIDLCKSAKAPKKKGEKRPNHTDRTPVTFITTKGKVLKGYI